MCVDVVAWCAVLDLLYCGGVLLCCIILDCFVLF